MATPTSASSASKQNGTAPASGGKRKHVASAAGVTRYGKPMGAEIGGARDVNHAAIQQDQGARGNYDKLISGDPKSQRAALDGMSTDDLNKLADIAFSFKSGNKQVVALRIAARNAQARRGIRVPVGQTQTTLGPKKPAPANYNNRGNAKTLTQQVGASSARLIELAAATAQKNEHTASTGSFPIPDVAHVRKAIQAIGRAKPEQRPIIARHIIARARALKCEHLVSDHIRHYARGARQPGTVGMSGRRRKAIELTGKWKHGYIPLDAEAVRVKMKGGKGKRWWGDSTQGGVSGNLKPHGSPKSGSPGGSSKLTNVVKSGVPKTEPRGAKVNEPKTHADYVKKAKAAGMSHGDAKKFADSRVKTDAIIAKRGSSTNAPLQGSGVTTSTTAHDKFGKALQSAGFQQERSQSHFKEMGAGRGGDTPVVGKTTAANREGRSASSVPSGRGSATAKLTSAMKATLAKAAAHPKGHVHSTTKTGNETPGMSARGLVEHVPKADDPEAHKMGRMRLTAKGHAAAGADKPKEKASGLNLVTGKTETREVVRDSKGKVIGTNKTGAAKSAQTRAKNQKLGAFAPSNAPKAASGDAKATPVAVQNGERYIQMHGTAGARQKVAQLEARGHLTVPERVQLAGLKAALASGGGPGKA